MQPPSSSRHSVNFIFTRWPGSRNTGMPAPPAPLARTIEAVVAGSLLTWACYRSGAAARWLRADLDAVLAPYAGPISRPAG